MDCFRTGWRLAAVGVALLLTVGCSVAGRRHDRIPREGDRRSLRVIDSVTPEQFASTELVTAEAASKGNAAQVRAQTEPLEKISVTLADVRAAALANNLNLEVELLNPAITAENIRIAEGRFDAIFGVSANRIHLDSPTVAPPALPVPGTQFNSHGTDVRVSLPSRTGGSIQLSRPIEAGHDDGIPEVYDSDWRFSISQPLLRGAGLQVNTALIRVAKYSTLQADALARLEVIRVLADAEREFWRVWAARKELEIRQQQYDIAEQQLDQVQKYVNAKAKAEFEITRAQAGIAQRVEGIIVARASLQIRERELKRIVNWPDVPVESQTAIETASQPELIGFDLDRPALVELALQNRPELAFQEYELASNEIRIAVAKNSRLPSVNLDASTNTNGIGGSLGQANDFLQSGKYSDYSAGLNVTYPFPNQTAKGLDRQARYVRAQTIATRKQLVQMIIQEVYDSTTLFEQNWQRILAARNNVRFATLDLGIEQRLFEDNQQNRTTTEVLNAAGRLANAQSSEAQAIAAYQIARIDVVFATGTLLGYGHVHWDLQPACRIVAEYPQPTLSTVPDDSTIEGTSDDTSTPVSNGRAD